MAVVQNPDCIIVDRLNLLKTIKVITMVLGGEGYLNFIGNEFNHPEWVEFPSKENEWSFERCRRYWDLISKDHGSYYIFLLNFEKKILKIVSELSFGGRHWLDLLERVPNEENSNLLIVKIGSSLKVVINTSQDLSSYKRSKIDDRKYELILYSGGNEYGPSLMNDGDIDLDDVMREGEEYVDENQIFEIGGFTSLIFKIN